MPQHVSLASVPSRVSTKSRIDSRTTRKAGIDMTAKGGMSQIGQGGPLTGEPFLTLFWLSLKQGPSSEGLYFPKGAPLSSPLEQSREDI